MEEMQRSVAQTRAALEAALAFFLGGVFGVTQPKKQLFLLSGFGGFGCFFECFFWVVVVFLGGRTFHWGQEYCIFWLWFGVWTLFVG